MAEDDWLDALDQQEEQAREEQGVEVSRRKTTSRPNDRSLSPALPRGLPQDRQVVTLEPIAFDLPKKERDGSSWLDYHRQMYPTRDFDGMAEKMKSIFQGEQSFSRRSIEIMSEDCSHMLRLAGTVSTTVREIKDVISALTNRPVQSLRIVKKQGSYWRQEHDFNEVSSKVRCLGAPDFNRVRHKFTRPIAIMGAGFGGITSAIALLRGGNENFVIFERHRDFGGQSWMGIANPQTKLQTEAGTYHINFVYPEFPMPKYMPVWPSRDHVLMMFRREARNMGLDAFTMFGTEIVRVFQKGHPDSLDRYYHVKFKDARASEEEEEKEMFTGAVISWPGNLCSFKEKTFANEFAFGGYIAYASCGMCDYTQVAAKRVLLYGHGAFAIENVRTLAEHEAVCVYIVCRRRNLTAPKMASWLISQTSEPATGVMLLKVFEPMYKLANFDPWTAHSVTTDKNRSVARIAQTTVFGVTDVYFIALYYGFAEVVVDDVKRCAHHAVHLNTGRRLECEAILKVCGIQGDPKVDKVLNINELIGFWVNGDAFRPCVANGIGVNAQNFGSFSVGPGLAGNAILIHYFLDHPEDLVPLLEALPACTAGERPAYDFSGQHALSTHMITGAGCPALGMRNGHLNPMKAAKQHSHHPLPEYMAECKREWQMYVDMIGPNFDKPPPPYPYTEELMMSFMEQISMEAHAKAEEVRQKYEGKAAVE